jgi:hypothetical protein
MRRFPTRVRWPGPAIALLLILIATPALSQTWPRRDVQGVVVDSATGQPIAGAWVRIADGGDGAYTNSDGRFRLHDVRIGTVAFEAAQLGYADFADELTIGEGDTELRLALAPDPVVLDGVRVISDRLASRRNAVPYAVRAYETDRIMTSGAFDAFDFVRLNAFTRSCGLSTCMYRRGRVVRPLVYIDEARYLGGLDDLRGLPIEHLYLIEVIGAQVRVYTKNFAERLATRGAPLMPMLVGW